MLKYELYDESKDKIYQFPCGSIAHKLDMLKECPAITTFPHIIETDEYGQICFAIMNLAALRSQNNIDPSLSDEEAIQVLEDIRNAPPEEYISAEERIASAMEFQNLLTIPDIDESEPDTQERIAAALEFLAVSTIK